jgi:cyclopropane-fatty-acyl-phospholipid synthase
MLRAVSRTGRAERLVRDMLAQVGVTVNGRAAHDITVHDPGFYARVLRDGSLGVGESYMDGAWDCDRLDELVYRVLSADATQLFPRWKIVLAGLQVSALKAQSVIRARRDIAAHYDLPVSFVSRMLGRSMTYSCGYFAGGAADLDAAQDAKHDLICRKLGLGARDRVLDVGCGWGGFARYAAERIGCRVVGVTLSREQAEYARGFCAGLPVEIRLADYRDPGVGDGGRFDKIVSVGMFEHVGRRFYATFMHTMRTLLAQDGIMLLHTVGRAASNPTDPWVARYIFPGGMLPSMGELATALRGQFIVEDWHNFGADYDRTLMAWNANCEQHAAAELARMGERFTRRWRFYLLAFAGNFRTRRRNQLWQLVLSPHGVPGGYHAAR